MLAAARRPLAMVALAAMLVIAALMMRAYPLDDKLMVQIERDLKERKRSLEGDA